MERSTGNQTKSTVQKLIWTGDNKNGDVDHASDKKKRRQEVVKERYRTDCFLSEVNHFVGLVVRASTLWAADLGFDSRFLYRDFSGSSHVIVLKIGTPVTTLSGDWRNRVSTGTGWPSVGILMGWDTKFNLQLLSQCGSMLNCQSNQPTNSERKKLCATGRLSISCPTHLSKPTPFTHRCVVCHGKIVHLMSNTPVKANSLHTQVCCMPWEDCPSHVQHTCQSQLPSHTGVLYAMGRLSISCPTHLSKPTPFTHRCVVCHGKIVHLMSNTPVKANSLHTQVCCMPWEDCPSHVQHTCQSQLPSHTGVLYAMGRLSISCPTHLSKPTPFTHRCVVCHGKIVHLMSNTPVKANSLHTQVRCMPWEDCPSHVQHTCQSQLPSHAGLPEHPQHLAWEARGEVERTDLQLPASPGVHPVPHPRLRALLQWAWLWAVALHTFRYGQLQRVWRQHSPGYCQMGHAGTDP